MLNLFSLHVYCTNKGSQNSSKCSFEIKIIFISVQPSLSVVPSSGVLAVKEGESATLQCDITAGSPTPEIKWSRRERMMPSGEEEISGNMITFSQVTRHHSGHYICSADNGFGPQPVTAQIKLDVQREYSYQPKMEIIFNVEIGHKYQYDGPS